MSDDAKIDPRVPLAKDRTSMAEFRTSLALERTTLAWIRTTITMSTFGLGTVGYFRTLRLSSETPRSIRLHENAIHFGVTLVVLGLFATVLVAISHFSTIRKLRAGGVPSPTVLPLSITISVLLALLMIYELWFVFAG